MCAIVTKSHAPSMNIAELGERSRGREMALHWKLKRGLEPRWGSWTKTFAAGVTSSALEICNKLPGARRRSKSDGTMGQIVGAGVRWHAKR